MLSFYFSRNKSKVSRMEPSYSFQNGFPHPALHTGYKPLLCNILRHYIMYLRLFPSTLCNWDDLHLLIMPPSPPQFWDFSNGSLYSGPGIEPRALRTLSKHANNLATCPSSPFWVLLAERKTQMCSLVLKYKGRKKPICLQTSKIINSVDNWEMERQGETERD